MEALCRNDQADRRQRDLKRRVEISSAPLRVETNAANAVFMKSQRWPEANSVAAAKSLK